MKDKHPSKKVFQYIEEKIIKGEWKPNDKITPELQLVKELNVSRVAVREALEKLVTLNILIKKRGKGTYVNSLKASDYMDKLSHFLMLGKSDYIEIIQFRLAIDTLAVRLFIKNCTDDSINQLEKIHNEMILFKEDPEIFFKYDSEFHKLIALGSLNKIIYKTTEMLFNIMKYNSVEQYNRVNPDLRIKEHSDILKSIKERDSKIAVIYMERHLIRSIPQLQE